MKVTRTDVEGMAYVRGYELKGYHRGRYGLDNADLTECWGFGTLIEVARWLARNRPAVRPYSHIRRSAT